MFLKQVESTVKNLLTVVVGGACAGITFAYFNGEIKHWPDLLSSADHGLLAGVCLAIGWLYLRSPFGQTARTLITSVQTGGGAVTTARVESKTNDGVALPPIRAEVESGGAKVVVEQGGGGESGVVVTQEASVDSPENRK